jgi:hypothetical protein
VTVTGLPDANSVLMGSARAASFGTQGEYVGGRILGDPAAYHVREYSRDKPGGGPLAYFPSGDPIMGISVDVQTTQRDATDPGDRGARRLYIEKQRQLAAVRDAVREAGASGLAKNGELFMAWVGYEDGKGAEPAKTWHAIYRPPTTAVPSTNFTPTQSFPPAAASAHPSPAAPASVPHAGQPAPFQPPTQYAPQGVPQSAPPAPATVPASVPSGPAAQTINSATAAAMRNAGIDTSAFNIVD